ncbi:MAG: nucleotidyltransferase domain-containing protein [Verrucomicrobiota bacterium]|nr:nucleotidyltransferase domain-containing protein [Verrucomicrobiota bacterium]
MSTPTIPIGTQVITCIATHDTNRTHLHPKGSVGIITRSPAGTEVHYFVRFPIGLEASLEREQFEILKTFKSSIPKAEGTIDAFDLEASVILKCVVGSRAYGLETDTSDTDYRGIYLAPAEMQWSLYGAPEQFEDNTAQTTYWELQKFLTLALRANPNCLECLYAPIVEFSSGCGQRLLAIREQFLSQMIYQTFNGYALSHFKKIEQDIRNHGTVRWKHAMHLMRLLITGAATLRLGYIPVRVESHKDRLLAIKRGEIAWAELDSWRKVLHHDFESALGETLLPERPDYLAINAFLINARRDAIR